MPGRTASRRRFMQGGSCALAMLPAASIIAGTDVPSRIGALEQQSGGRLGLMALDTGSGRTLRHRADERFALCSTFKWLLAAAVLSRHDAQRLDLERTLSLRGVPLVGWSPVTSPVRDGRLSIGALCAAAVEQSDNTAANLLLDEIGGPAQLTAFLRSVGDSVTRLDRREPELNTNLPGDPRDTTTPAAMVSTMRALLLGDALSADSRARLIEWMKNCRTGADRLRAGLPTDWSVGDKTGTGDRGAVNDLAIGWPPRRAPLLLAVYMSGSTRDAGALSAIHAEVARAVAGSLRAD